jgi:ADP-ribose pyrophosphatase YjhB (NUDIX family)
VAGRIDFYDDRAAPTANSLMPSVNVVVSNAAGEVLLIRRSDNDNWAVPGGAIDLGESMVQAAVRETREETGIECEVTGLVGIYTDPRHVILYTSNGEVRQEFSIVLTARATGGEPARSEESSEVRWIPRKGPRRLSYGPLDATADRALPRGTGHALPRLSSGRSERALLRGHSP